MAKNKRNQPPRELLERLGLSGEKPHEVYCPACQRAHEGHGRFLVLMFGSTPFYYHAKGKEPGTGKPRGFWIVGATLYRCDFGHVTELKLCRDGTVRAVSLDAGHR